LGLAMCNVLARSLGGNVGLESEPGKGATFFLCVPLCRIAPQTGGAEAPESRRKTALVVEDERYNQIVLKSIALELGYETETAATLEQAVRMLMNREFDVIFLDWELPGGKGGDIAAKVRAREGGERPIILATTAHGSPEVRRQCQEAGMDAFLLKPYSAAEIRVHIERVRAQRGKKSVDSMELPHLFPAPAAPLNLRALRRYAAITGGREEDAAHDFGQALREEIEKIEKALAVQNAEQLAFAVHRLRALGSLIAATDLIAVTEALGKAGGQATWPERESLVQEVAAQVQATTQKIADAIMSGTGEYV
jgi:CheY-like chemotaxis protein